MTALTITRHSHHFTVTNISHRANDVVFKFAGEYVQYGRVKRGRQWVIEKLKVFGAATKDRTVFRFHINTLETFRQRLRADMIRDELIEEIVVPIKPPPVVEIDVKPEFVPREDQEPVIDYVTAEQGPTSRFVGAEPGFGKSTVALFSQARLKCRGAYLFKSSFVDKWLLDVVKTYNVVVEEDIVTVQGSAELKDLLQLAADDKLTQKVILISNRTFQIWLKLYEDIKEDVLDMGYACTPPEFFEFLGVGLRVIDEVHLDFHLNYKIDTYTHVNRALSLSGTLLSDDPFIERMQNIAYPRTERYQGLKISKYFVVQAVLYQMHEPNKIRCTNYATGAYSHYEFEMSIMKNKETLANYTKAIADMLRATYLHGIREGDKAIVFCQAVEFCTYLTQALKEIFPEKDIRRYCSGEKDPYSDLMEADIRVSTHGSAGTAIDIPGLTATIQTVSMRTSSGSLQNLGRLRKLKDGRLPKYAYLTCSDIPKHVEYHEHRMKLFADRAAHYRVDLLKQLV